MYTYDEAITILVGCFPEMKERYEQEKDYYEDLPFVFYESEFAKFIVEKANKNDKESLIEIFKFVEDMLENGDEKVKNLLEVAVVESLYFDDGINDKKTLKTYFGPLTLKSYKECSQRN